MFKYGFHWRKPLYPFRFIKNIFSSRRSLLKGKNEIQLRGCEFDITFKCNFNCSHCSVARLDNGRPRKEMTVEEYKKVVNQAMELGAVSFGIEGGEPFVRRDWDKVIEACNPKKNHIIISSNGYLFNDQVAKKCAKIGVDTINFSLDNGIPELHDLFRKKQGSFERVINAVSLCRKYGIKVLLNTVVHKHNLYTTGLKRLIDFAEKEKILVHILLAKAIGNFKNNDSMLDDEDLKAYRKLLTLSPYLFVHHETRFAYGGGGCNGTKEMLQLTPYGDVMHCANMHVYFGNVRNEPLSEIRKRALKKTPFGRYRPCFLALDKDFMNIYYPLLDKKAAISIEELGQAISEYEKRRGIVLYPELYNLPQEV